MNQTLTKVCSSCGQQKSLSAFLQLSGEGTIYGNICSDCRKAGLDKPKETKEESTRSTTGNKIDAKAKVQREIDQRNIRNQLTEQYEEEKEKKEKKHHLHVEKRKEVATEEKSHRKNYIEKRGFLDTKKTPVDRSQVFGGEKQLAKERNIDLTNPFRDTEIVGKVKYEQSSIFQQFKKWVGPRAPIVSAAEKKMQGLKKHTEKKIQEKKESAAEFVKKTWGRGPK